MKLAIASHSSRSAPSTPAVSRRPSTANRTPPSRSEANPRTLSPIRRGSSTSGRPPSLDPLPASALGPAPITASENNSSLNTPYANQLDDDVDFALPAAAATAAAAPHTGARLVGHARPPPRMASAGLVNAPPQVGNAMTSNGTNANLQTPADAPNSGAESMAAPAVVMPGSVDLGGRRIIKKAAMGRSTREEWSDWMRRLAFEMIRTSPSKPLRACVLPAQSYPPLAQVRKGKVC